jgi:integrase
MTVFRRGSIWWWEFQFRGARIRESSYSPTKEVAVRKERERRRDLELGHAGLKRITGPMNVAHAVSSFMEDNAPRWEPRTLGVHQNSWNHLSPHFGKMLLEDISARRISQYQAARKKEGVSNRTINIELGLIRMVLIKHRRWHNISPDIRMLRERDDVGRALAPDEQARILNAAQCSASRSLYPAVLLSIHSGIRHQELRLLRWRQVDFLRMEIQIGKSKTAGGEGRVVPLSATALACLKEWHGNFPSAQPHHFVFPTEQYGLHGQKGKFGGVVKVYQYDPLKPTGGWKTSWETCRNNAVVSCRWHDMRHTFISRMGENGVPDQTLMAMTGQLSRKTLERYSHTRMESKRAAVRTFDLGAGPNGSPQISPQQRANENSPLV